MIDMGVVWEQMVGLKELRLEKFPLLSLLFAGCYLTFFLAKCISTRFRSYMRCCSYFYKGIGPYFSASTLMTWTDFSDTAAVYAFFRVARECADNENDDDDDLMKLSTFEKNFWECHQKGYGSYGVHPILPALIETVKCREYTDELLHRFFRTMSGKDQNDYYYMEGCASLIGEFMLPILEPEEKLHQQLTPHARDLGRALQMANIIRAITTEDWDLTKKYIPEDLANRHNVSLTDKYSAQKGVEPLIEEMFQHTDKLFASVESSLARLVPDVCQTIRLARRMYEDMHDKLRDNAYHGNLEVQFNASKIWMAAKEIPMLQLLRITVCSCCAWLMMNARWLVVIMWCLFSTCLHMDAPTYFQFHLIHTIPVLLWAWPERRVFPEITCLGLMAFWYTVPWDNMLVWGDGWSYPIDRVLGVVGWVPLEEYAFFVIETYILCGTIMYMGAEETRFKGSPWVVSRWAIFGVGVVCTGVSAFIWSRHFYFGSLLVWSLLCVFFQWWFSIEAIASQKWLQCKCIIVGTVYLCVVDHWGMAKGIWTIEDTIFDVVPGLPVEEALFFFTTSIMCAQGFVLILTYFDEYFPGVKKVHKIAEPNAFR